MDSVQKEEEGERGCGGCLKVGEIGGLVNATAMVVATVGGDFQEVGGACAAGTS